MILNVWLLCIGAVVVASSEVHHLRMRDDIESTISSFKDCTSPDVESFNHDYMLTEMKSVKKETLVTPNRLAATLILSRAALSLPKGDFVETGLWMGGTAILMLHTLQKFDTCKKNFWGFDSFEGLPDPVKEDAQGPLHKGRAGQYSFGEAGVRNNFQGAGIEPDWDRLHLVKGYFSETVPNALVQEISFLRLDGDMYISTWDPLVHLYPKLAPGGYIYIDDYGSFNGCREAVDKYRTMHNIKEPMNRIIEPKRGNSSAYEAVWWKKGFFGEFNQQL